MSDLWMSDLCDVGAWSRIRHMFDTTELDRSADDREVPGAESFGHVSGVVLAQLLAPVLADLADVAAGLDGDAQLVDVVVGLGRLEAWAVAQRARVLAVLQQ